MKIHSAAFVLVDIEEKGDDVRNALVSPPLCREQVSDCLEKRLKVASDNYCRF